LLTRAGGGAYVARAAHARIYTGSTRQGALGPAIAPKVLALKARTAIVHSGTQAEPPTDRDGPLDG